MTYSKSCDICRMNFPLYRKYKNEKSYFKIVSENQFQELMFIGQRIEVYDFYAKIFPDFRMIQDMILMENDSYDEITEEEFESRKPSL